MAKFFKAVKWYMFLDGGERHRGDKRYLRYTEIVEN